YISFLVIGPIWDRYGIIATMSLSALTFGVGYLLMYLAFIGVLTGSMQSVGAISFYYFLAGLGSCASFMATFAINLTNFPARYSGIISGILGIFYALSATLYAQIHANFYATDTGGFLLFMAISVSSINILATFTMSKIPAASASATINHETSTVIVDESNTNSNNNSNQIHTIDDLLDSVAGGRDTPVVGSGGNGNLTPVGRSSLMASQSPSRSGTPKPSFPPTGVNANGDSMNEKKGAVSGVGTGTGTLTPVAPPSTPPPAFVFNSGYTGGSAGGGHGAFSVPVQPSVLNERIAELIKVAARNGRAAAANYAGVASASTSAAGSNGGGSNCGGNSGQRLFRRGDDEVLGRGVSVAEIVDWEDEEVQGLVGGGDGSFVGSGSVLISEDGTANGIFVGGEEVAGGGSRVGNAEMDMDRSVEVCGGGQDVLDGMDGGASVSVGDLDLEGGSLPRAAPSRERERHADEEVDVDVDVNVNVDG
ncbi:hypothetical protein HDU76_009233, partial [Blyttiomyces sp. JEL0837]